MTKQDLKKNWHILKALKKGWIEPSDLEYRNELRSLGGHIWIKHTTILSFCGSISTFKIRLTKEGEEKIKKAKKRLRRLRKGIAINASFM